LATFRREQKWKLPYFDTGFLEVVQNIAEF
jgi:hypothetical protein